MKFESANEAAKRMNVTVRAVQKWAKEGKLPGAKKVGRDWQIPVVTQEETIKDNPNYKRIVQSLLNCEFDIGKCKEFIESTKDLEMHNLRMAEYYYCQGYPHKAALLMKPYIKSSDPELQSEPTLLSCFTSVSDYQTHLNENVHSSIENNLYEALKEDPKITLKALSIFSATAEEVLMHIPTEEKPALSLYMQYLPDGLKLFSAYLLAHKYYLNKEYAYSLGIAQTAVSMYGSKYPIPYIYLNIIMAIDFISMMRVEEAEMHLNRAWKVAQQDGFLGPFGEHHLLLQGLVERVFRKKYPEEFKRILEISKDFVDAWNKEHNSVTNRNVTNELSDLEFTIAMLYNRSWRVKEIAYYLEISERTVKKHLSIIYEKLGISNRKELVKYMLQ